MERQHRKHCTGAFIVLLLNLRDQKHLNSVKDGTTISIISRVFSHELSTELYLTLAHAKHTRLE